MDFQQKLEKIVAKNNSLFSVGFDPVLDKIPQHILKKDNPFFEFNKSIIDTTHDIVCAYKFNSAFYEALGDKGLKELKLTCDYINKNYSDIPIILDAKRGDIGNSNEGYVQYAFDYLNTDALTVMPYMGIESLAPYFKRKGKGIIVGCHSSNPGAREFQELNINGKPLYHIVAAELVRQHGDNPNCMIFMGATYPNELDAIRNIVGDMTILSPGVGAQEGALGKAVKAGINSQNSGLIINSSRSIIFASSGEDFANSARDEAKMLRDEINIYR